MKTLVLYTILFFQLTIAFGQVKTENKKGYGLATGDYKPNQQEVPVQNKNINTNDIAYQHNCYKGFAFKVINYGYNKGGNFYSWGVAVKNNYSKAVQLRYRLIVGNDIKSANSKYGTLTYFIKPGESYTNDYGKIQSLIVDSNSDYYRIDISEVCFEGQDCFKNGYADCNGKQTVITAATSAANSNSQTKSTTTSTPTSSPKAVSEQNDLSEYNRSKAELEKQMADKNAEIQRQNQEVVNRNAEIKRQQEIVRQQQQAEKQKAIEQVSGIMQDGALNITRNSLVDLQSTIKKEQALRSFLRGKEAQFPDATQYFNDYLKAKKKHKRLQTIGLVAVVAGTIGVGATVMPMLSDTNNGEFNPILMYGGIGAVVGGFGLTLFTIAPSKKEKEILDKARSYVVLHTTSNGVGLAFGF